MSAVRRCYSKKGGYLRFLVKEAAKRGGLRLLRPRQEALEQAVGIFLGLIGEAGKTRGQGIELRFYLRIGRLFRFGPDLGCFAAIRVARGHAPPV